MAVLVAVVFVSFLLLDVLDFTSKFRLSSSRTTRVFAALPSLDLC